MDLTEEELEAVAKGFQSERDPERTDYVSFCNEIDKIFTEKDLEKDPLKKPITFLPVSILDPEDLLSPEEEVKVDNYLKRLGAIVRKRRLHVKPMFQAKVFKFILRKNRTSQNADL